MKLQRLTAYFNVQTNIKGQLLEQRGFYFFFVYIYGLLTCVLKARGVYMYKNLAFLIFWAEKVSLVDGAPWLIHTTSNKNRGEVISSDFSGSLSFMRQAQKRMKKPRSSLQKITTQKISSGRWSPYLSFLTVLTYYNHNLH